MLSSYSTIGIVDARNNYCYKQPVHYSAVLTPTIDIHHIDYHRLTQYDFYWVITHHYLTHSPQYDIGLYRNYLTHSDVHHFIITSSMDSTPLRDAVLTTQLDLTLSGLKYNKFRDFTFDPIPVSIKKPHHNVLIHKPRNLHSKKLPAVPLKYLQPHELIPSKTPLPPKKSCSPVLRSATLERQHNGVTNTLRKSGSLTILPSIQTEKKRSFLDSYGVGQPEMKLPRTPRNVTPMRTQFTDPYTKYCALGLGRAQSTFKAHRAAISSYQSSPKGSITPIATRRNGMLSPDEQRNRVVREIFHTEDTYVKSLRTLTSFFYRPLLKGKLLPSHELRQLFPAELNHLLSCHTDLLDKLRDRVLDSKWNGTIGDIFSNLCPGSKSMEFFQMYSGYVLAFPAALAVYDKQIRSNEEFRGFIRACMESPCCRGLDLCAFLLTPIQRLPRYLLLLNELIKFTDSSHPDSYFANLAAEKFKACLVLLNDSIHLVLDIASKSSAWQNEPRAKSANRANKTSKKAKRASLCFSGISRTVSNSDLESNSGTLKVESCPPSFFDNPSSLDVRSPLLYNNMSAKIKSDPPPDVNHLTAEDKLPFSPPPLTSNKSHTDSGIYEDEDDVPTFKPRTPIPEDTGFLPSLPELNISATRDTSDIHGTIGSNHITEISVLDKRETSTSTGTKHKQHRRKSTDRILRLFKIFKSK